MWTRAFWAAALERALKSAAQAILGFWVVGDVLFNVWTINVKETLGIALGAFIISVLTSIVSSPFSVSSGPSLTKSEILNPEPPK